MTDKAKKVAELRKKHVKKYGPKASVDLSGVIDGHCIPSGILGFDYVTEVGGFPIGKHTELWGRESGGKSTLVLQTIARLQKNFVHPDRIAALYLDFEGTFSKVYAKHLGVDVDSGSFELSQPATGEEGMDVFWDYLDNELVSLVVVDSAAAMLPKAEDLRAGSKNKAEMGKMKVGSHAMLVAQALKQISARMAQTETTVIWINQVRTDINTTGGRSRQKTTGGNALQHYISMKVELSKIGSEKQQVFDHFEGKLVERTGAIKVIARNGKNKVGKPFLQAPLLMIPGDGFDNVSTVVDYCVNNGYLSRGGTGWYDTKLVGFSRQARGMKDLRLLFEEEPDVYKKLEEKLDWGAATDLADLPEDTNFANDNEELDGLLENQPSSTLPDPPAQSDTTASDFVKQLED